MSKLLTYPKSLNPYVRIWLNVDQEFKGTSTQTTHIFLPIVLYDVIYGRTLTTGLSHEWKVPSDGWFNLQSQSHDGKGHGSATLRGRSGHHGAKDHGDGHEVVCGKDLEVVVTNGEQPPYETKNVIKWMRRPLKNSLNRWHWCEPNWRIWNIIYVFNLDQEQSQCVNDVK